MAKQLCALSENDLEPAPSGIVPIVAQGRHREMPDESYMAARVRALSEFERRYCVELMAQHGGNISGAARAAGMVRHQLRALLRKHGLYGICWTSQRA